MLCSNIHQILNPIYVPCIIHLQQLHQTMVNFLWLQGLQTNHKKRRQFLGLLRAIDALYKSTNDKAGLHH
jgi:hypothetical protein